MRLKAWNRRRGQRLGEAIHEWHSAPVDRPPSQADAALEGRRPEAGGRLSRTARPLSRHELFARLTQAVLELAESRVRGALDPGVHPEPFAGDGNRTVPPARPPPRCTFHVMIRTNINE